MTATRGSNVCGGETGWAKDVEGGYGWQDEIVCSGARIASDAGADGLEQAEAAAFELGMESQTPPGQRSLERMMTGLVLAMAGGRLVWYRFEGKDFTGPGLLAVVGASSCAGYLIGEFVDARKTEMREVYRARPRRPRTSVAPLLSRGGLGGALSVSW